MKKRKQTCRLHAGMIAAWKYPYTKTTSIVKRIQGKMASKKGTCGIIPIFSSRFVQGLVVKKGGNEWMAQVKPVCRGA